jgi:hypothetical protein
MKPWLARLADAFDVELPNSLTLPHKGSLSDGRCSPVNAVLKQSYQSLNRFCLRRETHFEIMQERLSCVRNVDC